MSGRVQRLLRVSVTVSDLARLSMFYREALGFAPDEEADVGGRERELLGLGSSSARYLRMRLGAQTLELLCPAIAGRPYPPESRATDAWFQHVAIVVSDMGAAYEHLRKHDITPITVGGPQQLPPSTGRVTAFKFRDPDGHPLELIEFPVGVGNPTWPRRSAANLFLGFDHSAVVVSNVSSSLALYEGLGLSIVGRTFNHGSAQERLDDARDVRVDVLALQPTLSATPHVELLAYSVPAVRQLGVPVVTRDLASTRLAFEVDNLPALLASLQVSSAATTASDAGLGGAVKSAMVCDPDGHKILLEQAVHHAKA